MSGTWLVRIFYVVDLWVVRLFNALQAIHQGFWLGLLDREALHCVNEMQYAVWEKCQDPDYNLSGLLSWEEAALDRYFSECRSVLLGAAGGGREIIALSQRGIQVDAFECNNILVESCRRLLAAEGISAKVIVSLPDQVPEDFGTYDGLIIGWEAYIHIAGRETRVRFLKQLHRHVLTDGPILLSFFTRNPEARQLRWILTIARFIRFLRGAREGVEPGDNLLVTFRHHFTREEIQSELEDAGFHLVYYSETPYGHAVGRVIASVET